MSFTRRNLCLLLPAALVPAVLRPANAAAQEATMPSATYPFEKLPIRTPNNAQIRDVLKGKLATGESLEVHETTSVSTGARFPFRTSRICALFGVRIGSFS